MHANDSTTSSFSSLSALILILAALVLPSLAQAAEQKDGAQLLRDYLQGLKSMEANFRQLTLEDPAARVLESSGTFYLLRPDRFRWDYDAPWEQQIVADGKRVYLYDPSLEQVSHRGQSAALAGTPAQLLSEDVPPETHFDLHPLERDDGRIWVELIPKDAETPIVRVQVGFVDEELDTLIMEDRFGQLTRFSFSNLKRNLRLAPELFEFEQPQGSSFLSYD